MACNPNLAFLGYVPNCRHAVDLFVLGVYAGQNDDSHFDVNRSGLNAMIPNAYDIHHGDAKTVTPLLNKKLP